MADQKDKITDLLKEGHRSVLIVPRSLQGNDALCGAIALAQLYRSHAKEAFVWWTHPVPRKFAFLEPEQLIIKEQTQKTGWDAAIVLGTTQNTPANTAVYSIPINSTGCCLQLTRHLKAHAEETITTEVAQALLAGLIAGTNNFQHPGTEPQSLFAAAYLISKGADNELIARNVFREKPLVFMKLLGVALRRLRTNDKTGVIVTMLTGKDFAHTKTDTSFLGGLVQELRSIFPSHRFFVVGAEHKDSRFVLIHAPAESSALEKIFDTKTKNGSVVLTYPKGESPKKALQKIVHSLQNV